LEISYDCQNSCTVVDLVNCAKFYLYINDIDKFEEMIEMLNERHVDNGEDLILKGWRMCYSADLENIVKYLI